MKRVRLLIPVTYHPEAGGTRRQGEVFDLSDALGQHWLTNDIAEDASDVELTPLLVPLEPDSPQCWPDGSPQVPPEEATDYGAVLNDDANNEVRAAGAPNPALVGPRRQRRDR